MTTKITINEAAVKDLAERNLSDAREAMRKFETLCIKDHDEYAAVADAAFDVKEQARRVADERDKALAPARQIIEVVTGWFAPAVQFYDAAEAKLKDALRQYALDCEDARAKDLKRSVALAKADPKKAVELVAASEGRLAPKVKGVSFTGKIKFAIVDPSKLPEEFWTRVPDEKAIQLAVDRQPQADEWLARGVSIVDNRTVRLTPGHRVKEGA